MGHWLAKPGDALAFAHVKRFDPRFWTVNFPRPMMASVVTTGSQALRVDAVFYRGDDLAGLIWDAEDRLDHPLIAYATRRDFRGCRLSFRWRSGGVRALDLTHGPTLTIEGRDAGGAAKSWFVRLWNYAEGTPEDAVVSLDFDAMDGGFDLPGEADPVWAGDVDRMFISLVAPGYTGADAPLAATAEGWVEIDQIACEGPGSTIPIGDAMVPAHGLRIATGYDDCYNQTPARVLRNALHLGYRELINHYVGMSHYYRLDGDLATAAGGALNAPCAAWHADYAARSKALGYDIILSLSYELFDAVCPAAWKQRTEDGLPALTGWEPPSTLLSPANVGAMTYLHDVARAFVAIVEDAGLPVRFQIGEPWWWIFPEGTGRICLYDEAAVAAFGENLASISDIREPMDAGQIAMLDQAGAMLAASTAALAEAVRDAAPGAELLLLVYLPTVLDEAAPHAKRANVPLGWASPAFDVLQLEDYDWAVAGNSGASARGIAAMSARLGYAIGDQHYFSGFVLNEADAATLWPRIDVAAEAGRARGTAEVFIWASPQIARDGFTHFDEEEGQVEAFDDVLFPLALGREALVAPTFSTAVVTTASGAEQRNSDWANARLRFDAGPGVRSEVDAAALIGFFRARRGAARAFRFRDPFDDSSNAMTGTPGAGDQLLGIGDGIETRFALVKRYGEEAGEEQVRPITRPVAGSVRVEVDGIEAMNGWAVEESGVIAFDIAHAEGAEVRAGFRFDVPVRFAEDRLEVSRVTFLAGEVASAPLVEVRE